MLFGNVEFLPWKRFFLWRNPVYVSFGFTHKENYYVLFSLKRRTKSGKFLISNRANAIYLNMDRRLENEQQ